MDFCGLLADDIVTCAKELADNEAVVQIGDQAFLLKSGSGVCDLATGEWIEVPIVVRSQGSLELNVGKLIVTSMVHEDSGTPVIEIVVNGGYQWGKLQELRDKFVNELYMCLMRELETVPKLKLETEEDNIVDQVADEAIARGRSFSKNERAPTRDMILDNVSEGPFFRECMLTLGVRERAAVLKAVYSALVDVGLT